MISETEDTPRPGVGPGNWVGPGLFVDNYEQLKGFVCFTFA